jgi:small-conductance mechanosensitive channel
MEPYLLSKGAVNSTAVTVTPSTHTHKQRTHTHKSVNTHRSTWTHRSARTHRSVQSLSREHAHTLPKAALWSFCNAIPFDMIFDSLSAAAWSFHVRVMST